MKKGDNTARTPMALYRTYRQLEFKDVRGQGEIVSVLEAAVKRGKVAHSYLFAGGRGTGKTSMARILAHALSTSEQDIYEMDAARGWRRFRLIRPISFISSTRHTLLHTMRGGRCLKRWKNRLHTRYLCSPQQSSTACPTL